MPRRAEIVAEARRRLGTPYMHQQRSDKYCDCVGLVIAVARVFGIGDYRLRDYKRTPDPVHMRARLLEHLDPVDLGKIRLGDILWLGFPQRERGGKWIVVPSHLGIASDYPGGGFGTIHAYAWAGKVIEHRLDDRWRRRLCGAFSYRGVTD